MSLPDQPDPLLRLPVSRRLVYTEEAIKDLEAMRYWLGQPGSDAAARRRAQAIMRAIDGLLDAPCRFRVGERAGTRKLTVRRYVVVYKVDPDTGDNQTAGDVVLLRVFGPGQQQT
jgi:plasmid stabilization system protein ParE